MPISLVDDNPFNARCFYDDTVVARLSRELRADGQLVAAMAVPSSVVSGRYTLVDGHYRLRAINAAGLKTILLDVRDPVPNVELFRLSYTLNEHRAAHAVLDNALAWSRLLTSGTVASQGALQAVVGKSHATISKTLQLLELPHEVLRAIRTRPSRFTLKLGYSLALICKAGGAAQAARLAERALTEQLPQADVDQALRWAQLGKSARKGRERGSRYPIEVNGAVGEIRCWVSGKVSVYVSFTDPARQAIFVDQLKRMVAIPLGTSQSMLTDFRKTRRE